MKTFYDELFKMKNIEREGWKVMSRDKANHGRLESDAEHCFSMALLGLYIMEKEGLKLDQLKVLKMILYHELCEIDAGDATPYNMKPISHKKKAENLATERIAREYGMAEIDRLYDEFEEAKTEEAKFVKMLDKLDTLNQASIYSKLWNKQSMLDEFMNNHKEKIKGYEKYLK